MIGFMFVFDLMAPLRNFPPRMILQTLVSLSKTQAISFGERNIPADLISKLRDYFPLQFDEIKMALTPLGKIQQDWLKSLGRCVSEKECDKINQILTSIGVCC